MQLCVYNAVYSVFYRFIFYFLTLKYQNYKKKYLKNINLIFLYEKQFKKQFKLRKQILIIYFIASTFMVIDHRVS